MTAIRPCLLASFALLAACASKPEGQLLNANLPPLDGTSWRAENIGGGGIVDNAEVTAAFSGGKVSGRAGCNNYSGSFAQTGTTLKFGPLATTRRACAPALMDLESKYLAILGGVSSGSVDGTGALVLRATDGRTVRLRTTAAEPPLGGSLEGGPWFADGFPGDAQGKGRAEVTFEPGDHGTSKVFGTGGCNRFSGGWKQDGAKVSFGPLASTMMMCPEPVMAAESKFLKLLGDAATVSFADGVATLTTADGRTLVLRRAP